MDETEKMLALKKAYAEIILNTAKEAAARVMASERRAKELRRDAEGTKEEALRMLIRMQQMMDSKISEAEKRSQIQQKRIEELEAQLQEAEDIVGDLRAELFETQSELDKMVKNQWAPLGEEPRPVHVAAHQEKVEQQESGAKNFGFSTCVLQAEKTALVSTLEADFSALNVATDGRDHSDIHLGEDCCVQEPDFASILVRCKGPDFYKNGCTHRIRATEGNLLNEHYCLSDELDDPKNRKPVKEDEKERLVPVPITEISTEADSNELSKALRSTSVLLNDADKGSVIDKDTEMMNGLVVLSQESVSRNPEELSSSQAKLVEENTALKDINAEVASVSNGVADQGTEAGALKYTFHRKRKKASLGMDDEDVHEESTLKRTGEKSINTSEANKSISMVRTLRDSRRMAQVARQLISLAEKKSQR